MYLSTLTVCIGFEDYLLQTLPWNRGQCDRYFIVTDRASSPLRALARQHRLDLIETERVHEGGAAFNKGAAINAALGALGPEGWVLLLDADIVLPPHARSRMEEAGDEEALHGCLRTMCPSYSAWMRYLDNAQQGFAWDLEPPFRYQGSGRRLREDDHEAPETRLLPLGFFQLFSMSSRCLRLRAPYPEQSSNAGQSDLEFALEWPRTAFIKGLRVVHLPSGPQVGANWNGRRSPPFELVTASVALSPLRYSHAVKSLAEPQGACVNGLASGTWVERHGNGAVEFRGQYRTGLAQGRWLRFTPEGRRLAVETYRRGRPHGPFEAYHDSGRPAARGVYAEGALSGRFVEWHESGRRALIGAYRQGRKHGRFRGWHAHGGPSFEQTYVDGREHGPFRAWHPNGRPSASGSYWHGRRHGWFVTWYETGQKASQTEYRNGAAASPWEGWPQLAGEDTSLVPAGRHAALQVHGALPRGQSAGRGVKILENAFVGFEGLVFDRQRLFLFDPAPLESFTILCRQRPGFRWKPGGSRTLVPARLDLRWPSSWPIGRIHLHPSYRRPAGEDRPPFVRRFERLATLVHRCAGSYYHFVFEVLPRLLRLQGALAADPELRVLVDYDFGGCFRNTWTDGFLDILGVDPRRVERYDPSLIYAARELLVPGPIHRQSRAALAAVRDAVVGASGSHERGKVIAVGRADARCRRILNWDAVLGAVRQACAPAEVVDFSADGSPVQDQVRLFSSAGVIFGPHGAGLANLLFAPPGALVLEIVPEDYRQTSCFAPVARRLGLRYRRYVTPASGHSDDFSVPSPADLARLLRVAVNEEAA